MRRAALLAIALAATACEDGAEDLGDASIPDSGVPSARDASLDASVPGDATLGDVERVDGSILINATPFDRCTPENRIGLVELTSEFGRITANAFLDDRPRPWVGEPALIDPSCAFYDFNDTICGCDPSLACKTDGTCVDPPEPAANLTLILRAMQSEQVFTADPPLSGRTNGIVTLNARVFAAELYGLGYVFKLADTEVPLMLTGIDGQLDGTQSAPIAIDIRWDRPPGESFVHTHIDINHHVPKATFTECVVSSRTGLLHIDQAMLAPLAISTGLEFQGISLVHYAAARVPEGCVEFRFGVHYFVTLF